MVFSIKNIGVKKDIVFGTVPYGVNIMNVECM